MATDDNCCSLAPYFKVQDGQMDAFKALCERFVAQTASESGVLYYGFSFDGNDVHCREGYANGEAVLAHLQNVGALLGEALKIASVARFEVHGPEAELAKLREPMAKLGAQFFALETGFRR